MSNLIIFEHCLVIHNLYPIPMKAKILLPVISFFLLVASCTNSSDKKATDQSSESNVTSTDWQSRYDKIEASDLPDNVIQLIGKEWMLVTAGTKNSYNTMTASWGGIGYIWERPSTFIFIRDTRYTYQFLQREESFTLSFFDEKYRNALRICGTRSGRDTNKIEEAGLSPLETPSGLMSFGEARMIIECKKMFVQELDYANLTEPYKTKVMEESYKNESSKHQMFISEITNIWVKK
ncbi:hypothetical protein HMPREF9447_01049 [Bacteroides oleiciplenus YIT 12058]|uniref:Flavin reductase like domain-containing protein n=2 Tax=Bacteroides oleiciplenus TaxID=626931 RepID=K9E4M1_9BACE|nr:hypothetical protein HMPREF9447_01049 [Bacteroides oleiciplenus YIT 12058]